MSCDTTQVEDKNEQVGGPFMLQNILGGGGEFGVHVISFLFDRGHAQVAVYNTDTNQKLFDYSQKMSSDCRTSISVEGGSSGPSEWYLNVENLVGLNNYKIELTLSGKIKSVTQNTSCLGGSWAGSVSGSGTFSVSVPFSIEKLS
jgi:hypothetical protein